MKIRSTFPGILWDCHMHSEFSADSGTPAEDMIRQAIVLGLKGICFTEHLDPDYPPTPDDLEFSLELPAYYARLMELKEAYKNQIAIQIVNARAIGGNHVRLNLQIIANLPHINVVTTGRKHKVDAARGEQLQSFFGVRG